MAHIPQSSGHLPQKAKTKISKQEDSEAVKIRFANFFRTEHPPAQGVDVDVPVCIFHKFDKEFAYDLCYIWDTAETD